MRALFVSALFGALLSVSAFSLQANTSSVPAQQWQGEGEVINITPPNIVLKHQAIPALQWPAMTMPFALAKTADVSAIKPGDNVLFTLERAGDGFQIISLTPQR